MGLARKIGLYEQFFSASILNVSSFHKHVYSKSCRIESKEYEEGGICWDTSR
jgi:hypothetical protein